MGGNATQNWWHSLPTQETCAAFSLLTVLRSDLYKFSTYLQSSYMSLTTRKRVTCKNGEGSNACALPCGIGGVRGSVRGVSNEENRPVARPARTQALHLECDDTHLVLVLLCIRTYHLIIFFITELSRSRWALQWTALNLSLC